MAPKTALALSEVKVAAARGVVLRLGRPRFLALVVPDEADAAVEVGAALQVDSRVEADNVAEV